MTPSMIGPPDESHQRSTSWAWVALLLVIAGLFLLVIVPQLLYPPLPNSAFPRAVPADRRIDVFSTTFT